MVSISADDYADKQRANRERHEKPLRDAMASIKKIPIGRYNSNEIQVLIKMLESIKYAS